MYFYCLYVDDNNSLPAVDNCSQKDIHCRRRAIITYEQTNNIIVNNSVACC